MKKLILSCLFPYFLGLSAASATILPPLPYKENALEPYISERTLSFHYGKHHKGYVEITNKLAEEKGLDGLSLEELIKASAEAPTLKSLFNAAAQDWNHTFYWSSMMAKGGGQPKGP